MGALDNQVAGSHYKDFAIQPAEFAMLNKLDYCQANIVKYVCRFRDKNGLEDLEKASHYLEMLKEFYNQEPPEIDPEEFHEEFLAAISEA